MKKISMRILALMMAIIMAIPAMLVAPFFAQAATVTDAEPVKYGLVRTGNSSRGSGDNGCITNDGGDDNMSAILWEFDLSEIKYGYTVDSATLTEDIWSISNRNIPNQYLDFWYCNPADMSNYSNYLNNGNYRDSSMGYGTTGPSTYKTAFGITESAPLYSVQHVFDADSATISFSNDALVNALNKAADENWGSIVFVAMFNEPAATTWSDIWAGKPKLSFETVAIPDKEYVQSKIATYSGSNLTATKADIHFSSGGNTYSDNILYSNNGNFDSDYFEGVINGNNKLGFNIYPASSRVVYLYSSEDTAIEYPLIAKIQKASATATTVHFGVNFLVIEASDNWSLYRDWYSCSGDRTWDNTYDSQSDKAYGVNKINYSLEVTGHGNEDITAGSWYSHSEGHFTESSPITLGNIIRYDASALDFGDNYYCSINDIPTFRAGADGCAHWLGNQGSWNNLENWNGITINGKTAIDFRVLNIKPLLDVVNSADFKSNFSSIAENEWKYTDSSLSDYYSAVANIMRFDVNTLDVSDDTKLAEAAGEIQALINDYNASKTPVLKTFNVDFVRTVGETVRKTVTAGEELGELPSNSPAAHIASTNTHNAYTWNGVDEQTVVTDDLTVTETAAAVECSFAPEAHTDATEALNGYTTYSCVCGESYNEYDAQDWKWYDAALDYYDEITSASDYQTKYTASSQTAYSNAVEAVRLDESNETIPQTAIDNATDAISNAKNLLEEIADLSRLVNAYTRANEFLLSLDAKAGVYTAESLQALIDAVYEPEVAEYLNTSDLSDFGSAHEQRANELAEAIDDAYNSLESSVDGADIEAYVVAAQTINTLDPDVYTETPSIGSATRVSGKLIKTTDIAYADIMDSANTAAIKALPLTATQQNIDDATRGILDALYSSINEYTIITNDAVTETSFQNGKTTGDTSPYTATYGANVIAHSDDAQTAWYMEFSTGSTTRSRQLQSFGETYIAKVFGNITITAEKKTAEHPNMVRIFRSYSNDLDKSPLEAVAFTAESYVLPTAVAIADYSFAGYDIGGEIKQSGEEIEVAGDMDIKAVYTFNSTASYAVNAAALENGTGFNDSVAYNAKIQLEGGSGAYAWLEETENGYRPFAIGSDITFFATESTNLVAVTEEEFAPYAASIPAINMRKSGVITSGTKVIFNGQVVESGASVKEYGVVIGVSKNGSSVAAEKVNVNNAGSHEDYDIIRAKSTQRVGANQFTIGINGLAGESFVYRGYLIYEKTNGEFVTVYTDLF